LFPAAAAQPLTWPVGALAAWGALALRRASDEAFMPLGTFVPVGKSVLIGGGIVIALSVLKGGPGSNGFLAAVAGGAATTFLIDSVGAVLERRRRRERISRMVDAIVAESVPEEIDEEALDAILAKIGRYGMEGLSASEREQLEMARRAKLRDGSGV
jgi:hypothetical protein